MSRLYKVLVIVFFVVSCNSGHKKNDDADYSVKKENLALDPQQKESYERGKMVYENLCATCHMPNGKGATKVFPPLAQSDYLRDNQKASIKGIKNGMSGEIVVNGITYNSVMSPLGLTDKEVADVLNYINHSWGNNYGNFVSTEDVTKIIKN